MLNGLVSHEFAHVKSAYLNSAFMGPTPERARRRITEALNRVSDPSFMTYEWLEFTETARATIGRLLRVSPERISINASTSDVISTLARGLTLDETDEIALIEGEYPSNVLPWLYFQKSKVRFYPRELLRDPQELAKKLNSKTKVLNLSHVSFQTGDRVDLVALGEALRDRSVFLVVDVTQSLGGLQLSEAEVAVCDVLVCSPYKWLLSPYGQAFAFWSDRALQQTMPSHAGWMSLPQAPHDLTSYTTESRSGARKFDRGQVPNILGLNGLHECLLFMLDVGLQDIETHNQALVRHFLEIYPKDRLRLLTTTPLHSNILCFRAVDADSESLRQRLRRENIDVSIREGNIRISFHLFNSRQEIEKAAEVLSQPV